MTKRRVLWVLTFLTVLGGAHACRPREDPAALLRDAERLRARFERDAGVQAVAASRRAAEIWAATGDLEDAARALQHAGATFEQLGSLHESFESYQAALSLAVKTGNRPLESLVRSDVGIAGALVSTTDAASETAERQCRTALDAARASASPRAEARAVLCLAETAYHRQDLDEALEAYRKAGELSAAVGETRGEAQALLGQGAVHSDLSRFGDAAEAYARARSLWARLGDRRQLAIVLVADARMRSRRGEYQEAQNEFEAALAQFRPMGDRVWEGACLTGIASVYTRLGETHGAVGYWERALRIFDAAGLKVVSADILLLLAETSLGAGDAASALDRAHRALAVSEELGIDRWKAIAFRLIGVAHLLRDELPDARRWLERSLEMQRAPKSAEDRRLQAQTLADLGEAYDVAGEHARAVPLFRDALARGRLATDRASEARALFGLARASSALGDLVTARRRVEEALLVAESLRTEVESRDLRASYFASVYRYHELHVDVLMRLARHGRDRSLTADAFAASERARARSLLDSLIEGGVDLRAGVGEELLTRERTARLALEEWNRGTGPSASKRQRADYRDLEERYDRVQAEIRSRSPRYAALTRPRPLTLGEVQREVLDADTILLEYALGDERSYLWAVWRSGHDSYVLPPRARLEETARRAYDSLTARLRAARGRGAPPGEQADAEYWRDASVLSDVLLGPVAQRIAGKRLLVVADGALQYLPFQALPVPRRTGEPVPMAVEHEIVTLPSASVLALVRAESAGRPVPPGVVAVLADPIFEAEDPRLRSAVRAAGGKLATPAARPPSGTPGVLPPRLPSTRQEAREIAALASPGPVLTRVGFDASRAAALDRALGRYRIVHFATHGVFDNESPGLSGLYLSLFDDRGRAQAGFLGLHDIYTLDLPVDLVVLSACDTALGRPIRGEGLVGIVRGFMHAGARRVIASLWKVDDEATVELMKRFYGEMLRGGRTPAAALRAAQVAMWQDARWRPPFYWAAFVLQGEWR